MTDITSPSASRALSTFTTLDGLRTRQRTDRVALIEVGKEPGTSATVPGGIRLTLDDFSGQEGPETGHRPLPDHGDVVRLLEHNGITPGTPVVVYAETPRDLGAAARAWVVLRWAGVKDVSYLNDAHADALVNAALPHVAESHSTAAREDFIPDASVVAERDAVANLPAGTLLVDARPAEAFGDQRQHIPGAVSVPSSLLTGNGRINDESDLRAAYDATLGVRPEEQPIVVYCGSGVSASVQALALSALGVSAPVYIGSWSEWSKHHSPRG